MHFTNFCSRLRRGSFRYTKILFNLFYDYLFRTPGEAILGTLKYVFSAFHDEFVFRASGEAILVTLKYVFNVFLRLICFRASGEAIVGTLKYVSKHFTNNLCSRLRRGDFRYTKT